MVPDAEQPVQAPDGGAAPAVFCYMDQKRLSGDG